MASLKYILYGSLFFNVICITIFGSLLYKSQDDNLIFDSVNINHFSKYNTFFIENNKIKFTVTHSFDENISLHQKNVFSINSLTDLDACLSSLPIDSILVKYTSDIYLKEKVNIDNFNIDYILMLFEWAEQFKYWAKINWHYQFLFEAISSFWFNEIALILSQQSEVNPQIRNSPKFIFLTEKCAQNDYFVNIPETQLEKVQKNLIRGNWTHLISSAWNDTSFIQRSIFFSFLVFTLIAYYNLIFTLSNRKSLKK